MAREKKIAIDKDFTGIIICAVRYCLGRQTYMPGLVIGWIKRNMDGKFDLSDINVMRRDIAEHFRMFPDSGASDIKIVWEQFVVWLNEQEAKLKNVRG